MTSILTTLFRWPDGIVVGNLIASILWAAPALFHLHRKLNRQHAEHLRRIDHVLPTLRKPDSRARARRGGN